jgi:ribosome-associated protein
MVTARGIELRNGWLVPRRELRIRTSRSGGPGGQNVNKVETRVEVVWDIAASPSLDAAARSRLAAALGRRVRSDGTVHVISRRYRTQEANRREALARLDALLERALAPRRVRRATQPTQESEEKRLAEKRRRAALKRQRRKPGGPESD